MERKARVYTPPFEGFQVARTDDFIINHPFHTYVPRKGVIRSSPHPTMAPGISFRQLYGLVPVP